MKVLTTFLVLALALACGEKTDDKTTTDTPSNTSSDNAPAMKAGTETVTLAVTGMS